jgi:hypothetical protein
MITSLYPRGKLELPTLAYRCIRGDMIEVYKIVHHKYDKEISSFLKLRRDCDVRSSSRGHDLQLYQQHSNKNIRKHSFALRVTPTWNSLPCEVVNAPSVSSFKRRLDKCWSNQEIIYNFKAPLTRSHTHMELSDAEDDLTIEVL